MSLWMAPKHVVSACVRWYLGPMQAVAWRFGCGIDAGMTANLVSCCVRAVGWTALA